MKPTRRELLQIAAAASLAHPNSSAAELASGRVFPSVAVRYLDPATEFPIQRLTDPHFTSYLPAAHCRAFTSRYFLYASQISGKWDAFRMDLKTCESHQLTDAVKLDPQSLSLQPAERGFYYFDDGVLFESPFNRGAKAKARELYRTPSGSEPMSGAAFSDDGRLAVLIERNAASRFSLRAVDLAARSSNILFEAPGELRAPLIRPRHASVLFSVDDPSGSAQLQWINLDGSSNRTLALGPGQVLQAQWTADGHSFLFLHRPESQKLVTIREFFPESNQDTEVALTTQYVRFHANADASAFVGATGSKASPYVLLMARAAKRELTLAEHRASDPSMVAPVFAPDSQHVFFTSDRHGLPAIYRLAVDKLVAPTDGG